MNATMIFQIVVTIASVAASITGALLLWNFKSMNKRIDTHENDIRQNAHSINKLAQDLKGCKADCYQNFPTMEQFVRSEAYNRSKLDETTNLLNELNGKFDIVQQMPEICGQIAANAVKAMKGGK